jgi:hypothetical protein
VSTTLFTDLIDEVQLYTESVPRSTLEQFIRRSAITLCRQSRVWKDTGDEVLVPGEDDICIDTWVNGPGSTERQLLFIEEIRYDGKPLSHKTEKQLDDITDRFTGVCAYYQPALHIISLLNTPDSFDQNPDSISYTISVAPSPTAVGMDAEILNRYRDGIVSGAVGLLFGMPKKTWSNPQYSGQYMAQFAASIADATTDANQEFSRRIARTVRYGGI